MYMDCPYRSVCTDNGVKCCTCVNEPHRSYYVPYTPPYSPWIQPCVPWYPYPITITYGATTTTSGSTYYKAKE